MPVPSSHICGVVAADSCGPVADLACVIICAHGNIYRHLCHQVLHLDGGWVDGQRRILAIEVVVVVVILADWIIQFLTNDK